MGLFAAIAGPLIGGALGSLFGGGGDDDGGAQQPAGNPQLALLAELFSSTSALDALFQNIAAREDPTIPNLLNAQLSQLGDIQGGGGFDAGAFLGGDFSSPALSNPLTLGGADGPFNVPLQQAAGIDPIIQALIDSILTPATVTQGVELGTPLTELGSSSSGFGGLLGLGGLGGRGSEFASTGDLGKLFEDLEAITGERADQTTLIEDILGGITQQGPGPAPEANGPISGSFQQGGTVPFDGNFALHQGEQVIAPGSQPIPPISPGATPVPPPIDPGVKPTFFDVFDPSGDKPGGGDNVFQPREVGDPRLLGGQNVNVVGAQGTQALNPLQQAIQAILGLLQGGGPITPQIAQQQQQRISDVFGQQLQSSQRGVQENFGARGLGGSGIEAALGLEQALGLQQNAARASNDLAVQQALQNFSGIQGAAQGLGGLSLGAGQFGLQQQQLQFQQQQSLLDSILQTLQGTFAPGSGTQTVNIV